jgi:plasmid stabilization system protein ParE
MNKSHFHPKARAELIESAKYYETQQTGLGKRFLAAVRDSINRIERHPLLYHIVEGEMRQCKVRRFPYGIIFRLGPGQIEIVAVMHFHRKPEYWQSRLGAK